jgi:hypothetical protein
MIQAAPSGGDYYALTVQGSLVAIMSYAPPGFWTCKFSTSTHRCSSTSTFIPTPSGFCSSTSYHACHPVGAAFDKAGNLWFLDYENALEVELTKASHYSSVGGTRSYCSYPTCELVGIVIDTAGNHWVTDQSCTGNVYENGVVKFSVGDGVWGIGISTQNPSKKAHLYVGVENHCSNYPYPFVGDLTDLQILPSPYTSGEDYVMGISTLLYFTDYSNDYVWLTGEP